MLLLLLVLGGLGAGRGESPWSDVPVVVLAALYRRGGRNRADTYGHGEGLLAPSLLLMLLLRLTNRCAAVASAEATAGPKVKSAAALLRW